MKQRTPRINLTDKTSDFVKAKAALKRVPLFLAFSIFAVTVPLLTLTGCTKKLPTEVVLTSDFLENEVFRLEGIPCMKNEIMVYLANSENKYTEVFGKSIWDVEVGTGTLEQEYKETILARIAQIKIMNLLAQEKGVTLSEDDEAKVVAAGREYFASLTPAEISYLDVDEDTITKLYREFALANRLYEEITRDVNPEISDDEARTITVRTILIKTYKLDSAGNRFEYSEDEKESAYKRISEIKDRLNAGESFEVLAADYNEDTKNEYSFGRGVMPEAFEEAAFNLANGQISDIVETEYGYHLIYCVTTFNPEETDANKEKIVEKRKHEAFDEEYNSFAVTLTSNLNKPLWDSVSYESGAAVTTTSFFEIYDKYFVVQK